MSIPINFNNASSQPPSGGGNTSALEQQRTKLDASLLPYSEYLLNQWCGECQVSGNEITMLNPLRDDKTLGSFKFNTLTGLYCDFAVEGFSGFGLCHLFSRIKEISLSESVAQLLQLLSQLPIIPLAPTKPKKLDSPKVSSVAQQDASLPPDLHPIHGKPTITYEYHDASNKIAFIIFRFDLGDGKKEFRPCAWSSEKNCWMWKFPKPKYPLFNLTELQKRASETVIIVEGEKSALSAAAQFPQYVVTTSACGADQPMSSDWSTLADRDVVIIPDCDVAGRKYALAVTALALTHGASMIRVKNVWHLADWGVGDDIADHKVDPNFLDDLVDYSKLFKPAELEPYIAKAAADLSIGDFGRIQKVLAESLKIGTRALGAMVKQARESIKSDTDASDNAYPFESETLEPWEEPVDGEELFKEIVTVVTRYVILSDAQAISVATWIIFSYGFRAMRICPQLLVISPSKRCGKTTLLEVILCLSFRALPAANISSAAVFRAIEAWAPTLLIDEADTFMHRGSNDEITGILNSGHNKNLAYVVRTQEVNGKHQPVRFSTFCPKVIAMIDAPSDTIIDRSIVIKLRRKLASQMVDALAIDSTERFKDIRRRLIRWINDNIGIIEYNPSALPVMGNDRARQNWGVLAAFAKALGNNAYTALLAAAAELADTSETEENIEVDLLVDIREIVSTTKADFIQSGVLVTQLVKLPHRPWSEINKGKPLNENRLARLVKPFDIHPEKYRDGVKTIRGYTVKVLQQVFERYIPVNQVAGEV